MSQKMIYLAGVFLIMVAVLAAAGCTSAAESEDAKSMINKTLTGHNLTYYNIAGQPMNHTIASEDIVTIDPTTYKNASAWKVRVGTSLAWDLTMSSDGTEILSVDQLFRT
ncbi:hypothetical protein [Methanocella sp. MCL-LM]|uniref:hypothetical protein n=1 Tax=Methanocella sp. MCL-LM TaxID=3412035 RepID=UPI003C764CCE